MNIQILYDVKLLLICLQLDLIFANNYLWTLVQYVTIVAPFLEFKCQNGYCALWT